MLSKIITSAIIGAVAFLVCVLVGPLLISLGIPFIAVIGNFLVKWAGAIGLLTALYVYFSGGSVWPNRTV